VFGKQRLHDADTLTLGIRTPTHPETQSGSLLVSKSPTPDMLRWHHALCRGTAARAPQIASLVLATRLRRRDVEPPPTAPLTEIARLSGHAS
jgi:hypothetical protein